MSSDDSLFAFVGFLYDDVDQATYEGVEVGIQGKKKVFNTGDPVQDWKDANLYCYDAYEAGKIVSMMTSSSVTHFVMDGDKYRFIEIYGVEVLVECAVWEVVEDLMPTEEAA